MLLLLWPEVMSASSVGKAGGYGYEAAKGVGVVPATPKNYGYDTSTVINYYLRKALRNQTRKMRLFIKEQFRTGVPNRGCSHPLEMRGDILGQYFLTFSDPSTPEVRSGQDTSPKQWLTSHQATRSGV